MTAAQVTLCFLLRETPDGTEVLLGLKKTGFGSGKIVGIGGHIEAGESAQEGICREVMEETGVTIRPADLLDAGVVEFIFPAKASFDMHTQVFTSRVFSGVPVETSEIQPQWYNIDRLPVDQMWQDAQHWLPEILAGGQGHWVITMAEDNEGVASSLQR